MASNLKEAIDRFPVVRWLDVRTKVRDSGGENVMITCPVCRSQKLGVHRSRRTAQCFKCNEGGAGHGVWDGKSGLIGLIQLIDRCDRRTAIDIIFRESGVPDYGYTPKEIPETKLPAEAIPLSKAPLHPAAQMLHNRQCGHLVPTSYVCVDGRYSHRVLLPVQWFGELVGFDAKTYANGTPKSLFPMWQTSGAVHSTAAWDHSADFAVITESVLDAETVGINAIGILGSVLRPAQLSKLLEIKQQGVRKLVWFLDFDAWRKQYNAILRKTGRFDNYVVPLSEDADPNSLGREKCWQLIEQATLVRDELELFHLEFSRVG